MKAWRKSITDHLADILRFTVRCCFHVVAICGAMSFAFIAIKFLYYLVRWLDRILFSNPSW